jgi:hypothetical protein
VNTVEKTTYEQDFYAWAMRNAELIRQGNLSEIDAEHISEELESMGISEKRELLSRLTVLLAHLLKWQFKAEKRTNSWGSTIVTQRAEIRRLLAASPSLKTNLDANIDEAYGDAMDKAEVETFLSKDHFPQSCPYSVEQIMNKTFWPE